MLELYQRFSRQGAIFSEVLDTIRGPDVFLQYRVEKLQTLVKADSVPRHETAPYVCSLPNRPLLWVSMAFNL